MTTLVDMKKTLILCAIVWLVSDAFGQSYCQQSPATFNNEYISNVNFDGQFSNSTGQTGYANYSNNANLTALVEAGDSYNISVSIVTGFDHWIRVYFDWDDNGTFEVFQQVASGVQDGTYSINYTIPPNVQPGNYRMRVFTHYNGNPPNSGCGSDANSNGEIEDYGIDVCERFYEVVNSVNTVQPSTEYLSKGDQDQVVLGFNISVDDFSGQCVEPSILKSINFNQSSSTDIDFDVLNADLYYTGASAIFATGNRLGSITDPKADLSINNIDDNLSQLEGGDNWFWLAYDVSTVAIPGHFIDAAIESIVVDQNTLTNQTITVSSGDPVGRRQIIRYCIPTGNGAGASIDQVRLDELESGNSGFSNDGFITEYHSGSQFSLCANAFYDLELDYTISATSGSSDLVHAYAFFDWNNDGDYTDENERILIGEAAKSGSGVVSGTFEAIVQVPAQVSAGEGAVRFVISDALIMDPCTGANIGEMEEYAFTIETLGELVVENDDALCNDAPLSFSVNNANGTYNLQQSLDGVSWDNISGTEDFSTVERPSVDTNMYYRLYGINNSCPNAFITSSVADVPFTGVQYSFAETDPICAGDSVTLTAVYGYKNQVFEHTQDTTFSAGELGEIAIEVAGVNELFLNRAVFDQINIRLNTTDPASTTTILEAPNGTALLLSSGNGSNTSQNYNITPSANNAAKNAGVLSGDLLPEESFSKLLGIDPNGTWTFKVFSENGQVTVNRLALSMGVNDNFVWSPGQSIAQPNQAVTKAAPVESTDFISMLDNKYCTSSDTFRTTVLGGLIPPEITLNVDDPAVLKCDGRDVSFTADLTGEFDVTPEFFWYVNGVELPQEKSTTLTLNTLNTGDAVSVKFEANSFCGFFTDADTVVVDITPISFNTIEVSSEELLPLCIGAEANFTADTNNWFGINEITWLVNDDTVQVGGFTYTSSALSNKDILRVTAQGDYTCLETPTKESELTYKSIDTLRPQIDLRKDVGDFVCLGDPVQLIADTAFNNAGGYGIVQWKFDGKSTLALLSNEIDTFSTGNHTIVAEYVITESNCAMPLISRDTVQFEVSRSIVPDVAFVASDTIICAGETVTFSISEAVDAGASPQYQWFKNSAKISGATDSTYSTNQINTQDVFNVRLQTSEACSQFPFAYGEPTAITSRKVNVTDIQISTNTTTPVCEGTTVRTEVSEINGEGPGQRIQWFVNDELMQNTPALSYTSTTLPDSAVIQAKFTSTLNCATPEQAVSNPIMYRVNPLPEVAFTSEPDTGGLRFTPSDDSFSSYHWEINNGASSNQVNPYIIFFSNGTYEVCLTVTDDNDCQTTVCEVVEVTHVSGGTTGLTTLADQSIAVYPNPAQNELYLSGIASDAVDALYVQGLDGKQLQIPYAASGSDQLQLQVDALSAGMYIITVRTAQGDAQIKFHKR